MLVDQNDGNILSLLCEVAKRFLDRRCLGLGVDDQEVPLGIRAVCDVLFRDKEYVSIQCFDIGPFLLLYLPRCPQGEDQLRS